MPFCNICHDKSWRIYKTSVRINKVSQLRWEIIKKERFKKKERKHAFDQEKKSYSRKKNTLSTKKKRRKPRYLDHDIDQIKTASFRIYFFFVYKFERTNGLRTKKTSNTSSCNYNFGGRRCGAGLNGIWVFTG